MITTHNSIGTRLKLKLLWPLLLLILASGCIIRIHRYSGSSQSSFESTLGRSLSPENQMVFRYQIRDGHAALENERVVLVFHGLSDKQQRFFHFQGEQTAVQISGGGTAITSTSCTRGTDTVLFRSEYGQGTNTLQFGGQTVRLTSAGWLLSAGNRSVDLSQGIKVIHVKDDILTVE